MEQVNQMIARTIFKNYPYKTVDLYGLSPKSRLKNILDFNEDWLRKNVSTFPKEINSNGYRCDDFVKDHNEKHIVFTGCSVTWGTGLEINETWSKKIYDLINKKNPCSGYFNLAIPGSSIVNQIFDLFKYFNEYGNPDCVFINMPDIFRFYSYVRDTNIINDSLYDTKSRELLKLLAFQYYFMLHKYCETNNIKLFATSWYGPEGFFKVEEEEKDKKFTDQFKIFNTFYEVDLDKLLGSVFDYKIKNPDDEYVEFARDNEHFGIGYHQYWANFLYNKYLECL